MLTKALEVISPKEGLALAKMRSIHGKERPCLFRQKYCLIVSFSYQVVWIKKTHEKFRIAEEVVGQQLFHNNT
jgi:hypothetical protein